MSRVRAAAWLLLFLGTFLPIPTVAQGPSHGPIFIDGDADLCNDEDADGSTSGDDGIINCEVADGSAEAPYRIAGYSLTLGSDPACASEANTNCIPAPHCMGFYAAVALCNVTKAVLISHLDVDAQAAGEVDSSILLLSARGARIEESVLSSAGTALRIVGSREPLEGPGVVVRGTLVSSHDALAADSRYDVPVVDIQAANATLAFVGVKADGHQIGIRAVGDAGRVNVQNSTVEGALTWGLDVNGLALEATGSTFTRNSAPVSSPYADLPEGGTFGGASAGDLHFASTEEDILAVDNHFDGPGTGISITGARGGRIQGNVFRATSLADIAVETTFCAIRLAFNDFGGHRVVSQCTGLDARWNWWGTAGGPAAYPPQTVGAPLTAPALRVPLGALPRISITSPVQGTEVYGRVMIRGTATDPTDNRLQHVEVGTSETEWTDNNVTAQGTKDWVYTLNSEKSEIGPLVRWVRGVGLTEHAGIPQRLVLERIPVPRPPVALLEAQPRAAAAGKPILLDARDSYSPQGTAIVSYRIDPGDGRPVDWSPEPSMVVTYATPGLRYASLAVLDAKQVENSNVAQILVRIDPAAGSSEPGGLMPAPTVLFALAASVLGLKLRRRR